MSRVRNRIRSCLGVGADLPAEGLSVPRPVRPKRGGRVRGSRLRPRHGVLLIGTLLAGLAMMGAFAGSKTCDYVQRGITVSSDRVLNAKLPNGCLVSGTVTAASGAPLGGAEISAKDSDGFVSPRVYTDTSGEFSLPVRPGKHTITVVPPVSLVKDPAKYPRHVRVTTGPFDVAEDIDVGDIPLPEGFVVSGSVQGSSGNVKTLAGMMWAVQPGKERSRVMGESLFDGSGTRGTDYVMALPQGTYRQVLFGAQTYTFQDRVDFGKWDLKPDSSFVSSVLKVSKDIVKNVKLPRGYQLTGTVADSDGTALHGVLYIRKHGGNPHSDGQATAFLVTNGAFIGFLPSGSYDAVYIPTMDPVYGGSATRTHLEFEIGQAAKRLRIVAEDGMAVSGKVRDDSGKVVKFARVILIPVSDDSEGAQEEYSLVAVADRKGFYRMCVPAGTYDLHAVPEPASLPSLAGVILRSGT